MVNRISLIHQAGVLRSYFPASQVTRKGEKELIWVGEITPTPLSETYKIKLHYKQDKFINIYVLEPKLKLAAGAKKLPHVYSTPKQQLCLYYPKNNEWHTGMFYAKSLIPWASEWLFHYEIWAGSGEWHGGGIDHDEENSKDEEQEK
jgi:hypothetical protein